MATETPATLTERYRRLQARRAATIAALVATYYAKVRIADDASVERWIDLVLPKIESEYDKISEDSIFYGNRLRQLELPGRQSYVFDKTRDFNAEQIQKSLLSVGPDSFKKAVDKINELDQSPLNKRALIDDAQKNSRVRVAGAVARHTQNGGRYQLYDNIREDPVALGYIRVTKPNPCFFCAMLASRGIVYGEDSFDYSDPRFTGAGHVKVHDSCACSLKPVYTRDDPFLVNVANFEAMWDQWGAGGGDAAKRFRQHYEGREVTA